MEGGISMGGMDKTRIAKELLKLAEALAGNGKTDGKAAAAKPGRVRREARIANSRRAGTLLARRRNASYTEQETPRVYVGTYGKYNNGSLEGDWVDLDDFSSYDDFIDHCREMHSDEDDPEFMFQDYENFPAKYYGESSLSEELWDYIDKIQTYDKDMVDAILDEGCSLDDVDEASFYPDCVDKGDVARAVVDETGGVEQLGRDTLETYFDFDSYGRDLSFESTMISVNGGYVVIWN